MKSVLFGLFVVFFSFIVFLFTSSQIKCGDDKSPMCQCLKQKDMSACKQMLSPKAVDHADKSPN